MQRKNNSPLEKYECMKLAKMLDIFWVRFSHLAQSTYTKSTFAKVGNKRMWVRPWVPDYIILRDFGGKKKIIFIEMKRQQGGTVGIAQNERINAINDSGWYAYVCKWYRAACAVLLEHTDLSRQSLVVRKYLAKASVWI